MTEIISQCPKCSTSFRVSQEQLAMARGKVRCGFCMEIFKAEDFQITHEQEREIAERSAEAQAEKERAEKEKRQTELDEKLALAEQARLQEQEQQRQELALQQQRQAELAQEKKERDRKAIELALQKDREEQEEKRKQEEAEQQRLEQERLEQERLEKERLEQEKRERERLEQERLEQERLEQERLERERLEQERREQERLEQERLEQERLERERLEQEKLEQQRLAQERQQQEKLEQERLEQQRLEQEKLQQENSERERLEQERLEQDRLEQARLAQEKLEKEQQYQEAAQPQVEPRQETAGPDNALRAAALAGRATAEPEAAGDDYSSLLESGLSGEELDDDLSFYELDADLAQLDEQLASAEEQLSDGPNGEWAEKLLAELDEVPEPASVAPAVPPAPPVQGTPFKAEEPAPAVRPKPPITPPPEPIPEPPAEPKPEPAGVPVYAKQSFEPDLDNSLLPDLMDLDAPAMPPMEPEAPAAPVDWRWPVAAIALMFLLFAQYLFFYWNDLSQSRTARPSLASFCALAGCDLPVYRDLRTLSTDQLNIGTHPTTNDALVVDVIITNNGEIAQPFPVLQLTFFNLRRKPVATRKFFPQEYLDGELRGLTDMPSKNPVRLALEIYDPGETAVNYELKLLPTL